MMLAIIPDAVLMRTEADAARERHTPQSNTHSTLRELCEEGWVFPGNTSAGCHDWSIMHEVKIS